MKHGLSKHPLYKAFKQAKQRCTNPNDPAYRWYKGRWGNNTVAELTKYYLKEYEKFVKNNPGKTPSIDRIDTNGKYEIGNCQIISVDENVKKRNKEKGNPSKGRFGKDSPSSIPIEGFIDGKWQRFAGAAEAERETSIWRQSISAACKGKHKTAGGYRWRFVVS